MVGPDASSATDHQLTQIRSAYIELLKRSLRDRTTGPIELYRMVPADDGGRLRRMVQQTLQRRGGSVLAYKTRVEALDDPDGKTPPFDLLPGIKTMIGDKRLDNVEACIRDVIANDIPGDLVETGVWRGGTTIFMRGMLRAFGVTDRSVYVADSFVGLPPPNPQRYPADEGMVLHLWEELAVSLDEVRAHFERYDLLDEQVVFVKGWFRDTLPALADKRWSVIRLDGDLYESTMDALSNLYPNLSVGGWIIIDDFAIEACREAVNDYRKEHGIAEEMKEIDWTAVCWQRRRP